MADFDKLIEELSQLTVIEAAELVQKLEEKWGVSAAAPVAAVAAPVAAAAEEVEEKTEFDVVIKDAGAGEPTGHRAAIHDCLVLFVRRSHVGGDGPAQKGLFPFFTSIMLGH